MQVYIGQMLRGAEFKPHNCHLLLRQMFHLPHEFVDSLVEVPLPSYKVTPVDHTLSKQLRCEIEVKNLIVEEPCELDSAAAIGERYFNWERHNQFGQRKIPMFSHTGAEGAPYLQLGWLDSVGIYKHAQGVSATLVAWETEVTVRAFDHAPLRAVVSIQIC